MPGFDRGQELSVSYVYYGSTLLRLVYLLLVLSLLELCTACGLGVRARALTGGKLQVEVRATETANQNNPIAMDLLLVYDQQLVQELLKMSAQEWFDKREQLQRDYPNSKGFDLWSWEWVPGQHEVVTLPLIARARAGVIFLRYFSRGEHRMRIDPHTSIVVQLLEKDFSVRPMP